MTLKALVLTQKFYYGSKMSIKKEERITAIILGRSRDYRDNSTQKISTNQLVVF
jgi:hypothetical protein